MGFIPQQQQQEEKVKESPNGQSKLCARGHWRPAEDAELRELVSQHGPQNWNLIAEKLQGRSGKSCRLRWFNQLDPRISKRRFSEEEEERLLAAHRSYGNKWALIARIFPGRTDNAVKNHWHVVMARRQREQQQQQQTSSSAAFKRRKQLFNSMEFRGGDRDHHNACSGGESTVTSNRNGSLNSSISCKVVVPSFSKGRFGRLQQPQGFDFLMGSEENLVTLRKDYYKKFGDNGSSAFHNAAASMTLAMGGDHQSTLSDSTVSETSATELANNNKETNHEGEKKINCLHFFDFLGVGST